MMIYQITEHGKPSSENFETFEEAFTALLKWKEFIVGSFGIRRIKA